MLNCAAATIIEMSKCSDAVVKSSGRQVARLEKGDIRQRREKRSCIYTRPLTVAYLGRPGVRVKWTRIGRDGWA